MYYLIRIFTKIKKCDEKEIFLNNYTDINESLIDSVEVIGELENIKNLYKKFPKYTSILCDMFKNKLPDDLIKDLDKGFLIQVIETVENLNIEKIDYLQHHKGNPVSFVIFKLHKDTNYFYKKIIRDYKLGKILL